MSTRGCIEPSYDGKLSMMMVVPLDIFYEVVSHLHPKDLLALSRSSRHLHSLLMTSDASPYWRIARKSIDLPDGPSTINEAQYASLMFELKCTACGWEDTDLRFTQAYARFCDVCYALNIRSREDAFRSLHPKTMHECEGLGFELFVSEFEMVLPGKIDSYMSRRTSQSNGTEGWFYFPEFKAAAEEYTRVRHDPEALRAFTEARMLAVRENLEFRTQRGRWMAGQDAKDRVLRGRRNKREHEFLAIFRRYLPKSSERSPLQPPDEVVLREVVGLDDFLMEGDGTIPVTAERMKDISRSLVAHCDAFNRKIRRMMVVISKRVPMDKPFTMKDDECCEYLGRATTFFLTDTTRGQEWHTYQSFTSKMKEVREKKALFGMLDEFYVNEDYSERVGTLLEWMSLSRTSTWSVAIARQTELKVICPCRRTNFKQPGTFVELAKHIATEHPYCEDYDLACAETFSKAGTALSRPLSVGLSACPDA